ncbi:MAG: cytochrome c biogenesis protein ResB [Planctomycetota bacterium]|nr:cytochrome c biogenesis protein ResB [Planctomycetota bacterium]
MPIGLGIAILAGVAFGIAARTGVPANSPHPGTPAASSEARVPSPGAPAEALGTGDGEPPRNILVPAVSRISAAVAQSGHFFASMETGVVLMATLAVSAAAGTIIVQHDPPVFVRLDQEAVQPWEVDAGIGIAFVSAESAGETRRIMLDGKPAASEAELDLGIPVAWSHAFGWKRLRLVEENALIRTADREDLAPAQLSRLPRFRTRDGHVVVAVSRGYSVPEGRAGNTLRVGDGREVSLDGGRAPSGEIGAGTPVRRVPINEYLYGRIGRRIIRMLFLDDIYHAWWFYATIGFLCVSITAATFRRWPLSPARDAGLVLSHTGAVLVAVGSALWLWGGMKGCVRLYEDGPAARGAAGSAAESVPVSAAGPAVAEPPGKEAAGAGSGGEAPAAAGTAGRAGRGSAGDDWGGAEKVSPAPRREIEYRDRLVRNRSEYPGFRIRCLNIAAEEHEEEYCLWVLWPGGREYVRVEGLRPETIVEGAAARVVDPDAGAEVELRVEEIIPCAVREVGHAASDEPGGIACLVLKASREAPGPWGRQREIVLPWLWEVNLAAPVRMSLRYRRPESALEYRRLIEGDEPEEELIVRSPEGYRSFRLPGPAGDARFTLRLKPGLDVEVERRKEPSLGIGETGGGREHQADRAFLLVKVIGGARSAAGDDIVTQLTRGVVRQAASPELKGWVFAWHSDSKAYPRALIVEPPPGRDLPRKILVLHDGGKPSGPALDMPDGVPLSLQSIGLSLTATGIKPSIKPAVRYLPGFDPKAPPVLRISLVSLAGDGREVRAEGYVLRSRDAAGAFRPESELLPGVAYMPIRKPHREFRTEIAIEDDAGRVLAGPMAIRVNEPAGFAGFGIYQQDMGIEPDLGSGTGGRRYSVLRMVRDPGRYFTCVGILAIAVGTAHAFYLRPLLATRRRAGGRNGEGAASAAPDRGGGETETHISDGAGGRNVDSVAAPESKT